MTGAGWGGFQGAVFCRVFQGFVIPAQAGIQFLSLVPRFCLNQTTGLWYTSL
jgi:hypothetical protein